MVIKAKKKERTKIKQKAPTKKKTKLTVLKDRLNQTSTKIKTENSSIGSFD